MERGHAQNPETVERIKWMGDLQSIDNSALPVATQLLRFWIVSKHWGSHIIPLWNVLGYLRYEEMEIGYNQDDVRTIKLLLGPNGHTIYKMLLLKHGIPEDL